MSLHRLSSGLLAHSRHHLPTASACLRLGFSSTTTQTDPPPPKASGEATKAVAGPPELLETKWQIEFHQKEKGIIAGKLPGKVSLKKGKTYAWCTCGFSKTQPLCDDTHTMIVMRIKLRPIVFKAPDDMDVWLCTCKQTKNRPFCDGTHRTHPDVIEWKKQ